MRLTVLVVTALLAMTTAGEIDGAPPAVATSPDGRVRIELSLRNNGQNENVPHYRVTFGDTEVVGYSRLGIDLEDGSRLGGPCAIEEFKQRPVREEYTQVTGKRRAVVGEASE